MLKRSKIGLIVSLLLCFTLAPAHADKLFVRNQPFKGAVRGSGKSSMVELAPFVEALGLTIKPCNGGFLVTTDPKSDQGTEICEAGQAVVDGNKIALISGTNGETLISLSDLCDSIGAKLLVNHDAGSMDVYLESKTKARGPSLKDDWGAASRPVVKTVKVSSSMPEGPGKVGVQFFETFSFLPPCRDMKEMSQLCHKQGDIEKFRQAYQTAVTPELYEKSYSGIQKHLDNVVQMSVVLSSVPIDDLEKYVATKPDVAKQFTASLVSWETMRSTSATLANQEVRGNEALLHVYQTTTNPVSGKTESKKIILHLIHLGTAWKVDAAQLVN